MLSNKTPSSITMETALWENDTFSHNASFHTDLNEMFYVKKMFICISRKNQMTQA